MNYNSTENQTIKEKFVDSHVIWNIGEIMTDALTECPELEEQTYVSNYIDPAFEYLHTLDRSEIKEYLEDYQGMAVYDNESKSLLIDCITESEESSRDFCEQYSIEPYYPEIFEWWIVDQYLGSKLIDQGQIVVEYKDFPHVWGRQATGQSIVLDHVISVICENAELIK